MIFYLTAFKTVKTVEMNKLIIAVNKLFEIHKLNSKDRPVPFLVTSSLHSPAPLQAPPVTCSLPSPALLEAPPGYKFRLLQTAPVIN